jgi:hypothetical protein
MEEFDLEKVNDGEHARLKCETCLHLWRTWMVAGALAGFKFELLSLMLVFQKPPSRSLWTEAA